jgi:Flp pilus assembly pilin Flp
VPTGLARISKENEVQYLNDLMTRLISMVTDAKDESGQTLVEYALIIALVSVTAVLALGALSGGINGVFSSITATL